MDSSDSIPLRCYHAPTDESSRPLQSSDPILAPAFEFDPGLINMVRILQFSGEDNANPYTHLRNLETLCDTIRFEGMSDNTIRWKLFRSL